MQWQFLVLTRLVFTGVLTVGATFELVYHLTDDCASPSQLVAAAVRIASYAFVIAYQVACSRAGFVSSAALFLFWLVSTLCSGLSLASIIAHHREHYYLSVLHVGIRFKKRP